MTLPGEQMFHIPAQQEEGGTSSKPLPLFNKQIMIPSLEDLRLSALNIESIWHNQLGTMRYSGQNLRSLSIERCDYLKCLLSHSVAGCLVQLRRLAIIGCRCMQKIIETEEQLEEVIVAEIIFPLLKSLKIKRLPYLRGFYFGYGTIDFPSLEEVIVEQCPRLETFSRAHLSTPKLRNVEISEGEGSGLWAGDLNTTIRLLYEEKYGTESEGELDLEAGRSGTEGEPPVQWRAMLKDEKVETFKLPPIDFSSPEIEHESYQRPVPEKTEEIDEAQVILASAPVSESDTSYPISVDVELTTETATTPPVENPLLATENPEIFHDEDQGMLSSHEIETEAAHSEKELDQKVPEVTENVSQSIEPASTLAFSTPSNRPTMESVAVVPSAKDDIPVIAEAKAEIPSQTEDVPEIYETGVAAVTTIERSVSKVLEYMGTNTVRKIAVHGVCGVGKSSVLRALVNNPKTKREFDLIIWVTVSKYWSTGKIKDQIIQQLPRASSNAEPFQNLKGKKFLLLLDDVWQRIDLQEIGIPEPSQENGSMMILATRELKVCHDMEEIRVIEIEPVSKEEAWKLFHEQVGGVLADLPDIQHFAEGIVEGCCGLPLLITVTGRALANEKNVIVWEHAFNEFSVPGRDIKSCIEDLIQLLKFSFGQLKSPSLKGCFLYCALFSEDEEINPSEFIEYCIKERLIDGTCYDAYKRGHGMVDALLRAFLLDTTDCGRSIRMRDVMRDLAFGILSGTEGCQFLLMNYSKALEAENIPSSTPHEIPKSNQFLWRVAAGLTEPPTEEEWKQSKMMFLMDNELSTLPEKPFCPELVALFLQRNYQLRVVPDLFFDLMRFLTVLNLSKTRIKFLPRSISNLGRLETLILRDCERLVKLPSEVGSLSLLQVLDLGGTEIIELPEEIGKLDSLSHLEVSFYGSSTNNEHVRLPRELISSLQALETLRISVYPGDNWWKKSVGSFVKEVCNLKKLTSLSIYIPEVEFLEPFLQRDAAWNIESLKEFKFVVGHDVEFNASRVPKYVELNYGLMSGKCLRFVNSEKILGAVVTVLAHCTAFYLDHHLDIKRLSEFGIGNINKLKYCIISECPDLEIIVDSRDGTEAVFPLLEQLSIHYSWSLACIWEGVVPEGSFAALRTLSLHACPKLTYVFKSSMLQFIPNLEELQVDDCEAIEKIVSAEEVTESAGFVSLKSLTLHHLPELVHIWEGTQTQLLFEHISVHYCPKLKKISIDTKLKETLEEIRAEKGWWDELVLEGNESRSQFEDIFIPIPEVMYGVPKTSQVQGS